jgi:hypothetical protein
MAEKVVSRSERYLRFSRRGMVVILVSSMITGGSLLVLALDPDGALGSLMPRISALIPMAIAIVAGMLVATLGGHKWDPEAPEARAILEDEWRRANMNRAIRVAFVVVLAAQVPLGFWLASVPSPRGILALATTTMTLGLAVLAGLFLYFDREPNNGG